MEEFLNKAGTVAGIGGLSLGLVSIIFKSVIVDFLAKKSPRLSKQQVFLLINSVVRYTFSVAVIGIFAWVLSQFLTQSKTEAIEPKQIDETSVESKQIDETSVESKANITEFKEYEDLPINYGDFTALKQFELAWSRKLKAEGFNNAEAYAHVKAIRLVETVWKRRKAELELDQGMAALLEELPSIAEEKKEALTRSQNMSHISRRKGLEYQIQAKFGLDTSIDSPVDTNYEISLITNYSATEKRKWYFKAQMMYSPISAINFSAEN